MSIAMRPSRPHFNESRFVSHQDWSDFYGDVHEEIPADAPEPLGPSVKVTCFVDANHAGNVVTRRSQTGYIFYVNNAPILWYSKRQNTVEASTFGSEFIAMRTVVEVNEALRFKLRMFGIAIDGPTDIFSDNQSVVNSGQRPESTLSKKHLSICYHRSREAVASGSCRIGKVTDDENVADIFTKLVDVPKRQRCLGCIAVMSHQREAHGRLRDVDQKLDIRLNRQSPERG